MDRLCTARFPDNKRARHSDRANLTHAIEPREQTPSGLPPKIMEIHVNRCQRRPRLLGKDVPVVEPDNGDIIWDPPAMLAESSDYAARDDIAATKDGVHVWHLPQKAVNCLDPPEL